MIKKYYIYRITNLINGKTYIGQHKYKELDDSYMGSGKLLWKAYRKYGIENFTKEILYKGIRYKETADSVEIYAIAKERKRVGIENCYNIANGGTGGNLGDEVNKKISEAHKGKPSPRKGKHHSEETKRKISEANKGNQTRKGKHHSEETKRKISETLKGHTTWNKGKHLKPRSEETKRKISETLKEKCWFNDGKVCIRTKECPEGFVPGRLK